MVRIAILEDDAQDLASLEKCLQQYETEQQKSFSLHSFSDPAVFLEGNISDYDLIFLDIDLPTMTGMDLGSSDPPAGLAGNVGVCHQSGKIRSQRV